MRCNNCGWDNFDNAGVCIKCNTTLEQSKRDNPQKPKESNHFGRTVTDKDLEALEQKNEKVYAKTLPDVQFGESGKSTDEKDELKSCTCGFLNAGDATICVKCKAPLFAESTSENHNESIDDKVKSGTIPGQSGNTKQSFSGTVDPYRKNHTQPKCHLTTILRDGEINQHNPGRDHSYFDRNFTMDSNPIELNRENLDKDNYTITSKVQAELSFKNGKWYLKDKSEQQTTFILAKDEIELQEGDIILMGDRKFKFSTVDKSMWT